MKKVQQLLIILLVLMPVIGFCSSLTIEPGAKQTSLYLPMLKGKRVAVFVNHTSLVGQTHLIDVLLNHHINVTKIFVPEHGFRGTTDGVVNDALDTKTGIPIISLYGKKLSPSAEDLSDVDILIFDIQDVGVRFYTYISSLQKLMEAAIINHKSLIVLDRPNPNGFYVDGPVLNIKYKSFTGMQPIPLVYGMTIGEYAKMLVGEEWLEVTPKNKAKELQLTIVSCKNYTHKSLYVPPVKPSPNLPNIQSIYLYPSIGLMEGTVLSVGRGTPKPFQYFGHPQFTTKFSFIPTANNGALHPPYENLICRGWNIKGSKNAVLKKIHNEFQTKYILKAFREFPDKGNFFKKDFNLMSGNETLIEQIKLGTSEAEIRKSWEPELKKFKEIRKKYLLYPDF